MNGNHAAFQLNSSEEYAAARIAQALERIAAVLERLATQAENIKQPLRK